MNLCLAIGAAILSTAAAGKTLEEERTFHLVFESSNNQHRSERAVAHFEADARGERFGRPLSTAAQCVSELPASYWTQAQKSFPIGQTDQAARWPAEKNIDPRAGAVVVWVKGLGWDLAAPGAESLWVLETADGDLVFGKTGPKTFGLALGKKTVVEFPASFQADRLHQFVVNYDKSGVKVYLDGRQVGQGALPAAGWPSIEHIVVGHKGPGTKVNRLLVSVSIYARPLTLPEIMRLWLDEGRLVLRKRVTLMPTRRAIQIDGLLDPAEWADAAVITGLLTASNESYVWLVGPSRLTPEEDRLFLTYDKDWLYVGYHCPPPAKIRGNAPIVAAMLKNSRPQFDSDVDADDSFWIEVHHPYPWGDMYHLIVNGINTHYEFTDGGQAPGSKLVKRRLGWNPDWKSKSTLDLDGWHLEIALPFKDFEIPAPKAGDLWHVNFARIWQSVLSGLQVWCTGNRTWDKHELVWMPTGEVVFGPPEAVVVKLDRVGPINQGTVDVQARLLNPGPTPQTVTVEVITNSGELTERRSVTLPAGAETPYRFTGKIIDYLTATVALRVTDAAGQVIYETGFPVRRRDKAELYLRKYPTARLVKFEVNVQSQARFPASEIVARARLVDSAGRTVAEREYTSLTSYEFVAEFPMQNARPDRYRVEFAFLHAGQVLETAEADFQWNALPEWYNNTIGSNPERAPYPWTDLQVSGQNLNCWGRVYQFGDLLLPEQVYTQGKPTLRSAMHIELATAEAGALDSAARKVARRSWTRQEPCRVEGVRELEHGHLLVRNSFWAEYDGLVWCRLTLDPQAPVTVQRLVFEIPFNAAFSDVMNPSDYSLENVGRIRPEGYTSGVGRAIWVGNGTGGIQWNTEGDGPYHVRDRKSTLRVVPGKAGASIVITMIDQPTRLDRPRHIEFGFQATPVRKRTWRTLEDLIQRRIVWSYVWYSSTDKWVVADPGWKHYSFNRPAQGGATAGLFNWCAVYQNYTSFRIDDPAMEDFGDEWLANADERWRGPYAPAGQMVLTTPHARSLVDYVVWKHQQLYDANPFQGGYFDVAGPVSSANPYAGAGYVDEQGVRHASNSLLGVREISKRLYHMTSKHFPGGGTVWHDSGDPNMMYCAFAHMTWDGENLNSRINEKQPTYRGVLRPDVFRAEYMGHNFGPKVGFLGQGRLSRETCLQYGLDVMCDHVAGLQLLHDADVTYPGGLIHNSFHKSGQKAYERQAQAFLKYHMASPAYRFIPYWEQDIVKVDRPELFVSFYVRQPLPFSVDYWQYYDPWDIRTDLPHQVVLIVCNESDYKGAVRLKPDWAKLGFKTWQGLEAINAVHSTGLRLENPGTDQERQVLFPKPEEYAKIADGVLEFPITEWNYRMIVVREPEAAK